jgi:Tfp pilus assembly protein PilF
MNMRHNLNLSMVRIGVFFLLLLCVGCNAKEGRIKKEKESTSYHKLGLAHLSETPPNMQKAYVEFLKAVEADRRNHEAFYALGHVYFQRQEYTKAIEAFKKALSLDSNYSEAANYLGKAFEFAGREEEAILAYQEAIKNLQYATPQLPHWNLGLIYLKQKKYDTALAELKEVLQIEPQNAVVLRQIGEIYIEMGRPQEARPFFERLITLSPESDSAKEAQIKLETIADNEGKNGDL